MRNFGLEIGVIVSIAKAVLPVGIHVGVDFWEGVF